MNGSFFLRWAPLCGALLMSAAGLLANAQTTAMPQMNMGKSSDTESSPSTKAFKAASEKMMRNMSSIPFSGDPDRDFVAHMIPHHEGAVEVAEVELKYGKDPAMKKLASEIIAAQKKEIAFMKQWQARHPAR